jgi:hypothetical protein
MQELVEFLIDERYCNTESEAIKILESVSDEFYEEVSAAMRLKGMRGRMDSLISQLMKDPNNIELQRKIKTIRGSIPQQETISKAERVIKTTRGDKGIAKTPGVGAQTSDTATTKTAAARKDRPMTGAQINDPRVAASVERQASRMTGTSSEVSRAGGASSKSTGVVKTGKYSQMQTGSGATAAVPNKGTSRTGSRFPRQRG